MNATSSPCETILASNKSEFLVVRESTTEVLKIDNNKKTCFLMSKSRS